MIGLTYTRQGRKGRRRDGFMSFISGISVASIALGVAALIIVLSVMNGFQKEVRDRMLSVIPHIEVTAVPGPLKDAEGLAKELEARGDILAAAPYVQRGSRKGTGRERNVGEHLRGRRIEGPDA